MNHQKVIIIGLGRVGIRLLEVLSDSYELICIDVEEQACQNVLNMRKRNLTTIIGDASSRLILEKADVNSADLIIITTTTEELNIEITRVLNEYYQAKQVVAIGITSDGTEILEKNGAEVEDIFTATVIGLMNRIENRTKMVHGIGLGLNEIQEVEVHPFSKLAHKSLLSITAHKWRVGIIYRKGKIVIPKGNTVLKPRDRVVILGEPKTLQTINEILTFRYQYFPLEYGDSLFVFLDEWSDDTVFEEVQYIQKYFPINRIIFFTLEEDKEGNEALTNKLMKMKLKPFEIQSYGNRKIDEIIDSSQYKCGLMAFSNNIFNVKLSSLKNGFKNKSFFLNIVRNYSIPVIILRGSFPYDSMLSFPNDEDNASHLLEHVIEISSVLNNRYYTYLFKPMTYLSNPNEQENYKKLKQTVQSMANIYKESLNLVELEGNPIKSAIPVISNHQLLIIDSNEFKKMPPIMDLLTPDIAWENLKRAKITTLILPGKQEDF